MSNPKFLSRAWFRHRFPRLPLSLNLMKNAPGGFSPVIAVDRMAAKSLHRQICDAYRAAIVGRGLQPGQQIQPVRLLAEGYFQSRELLCPVPCPHRGCRARAHGQGRVRLRGKQANPPSLPGPTSYRELSASLHDSRRQYLVTSVLHLVGARLARLARSAAA